MNDTIFIFGCMMFFCFWRWQTWKTRCEKAEQERDIQYSNYQNCLRALAEYDPVLKNKLRKDGFYGQG